MKRSSDGAPLQFAVDTGGTFTDLVVGSAGGRIAMYKTPTAPDDPAAGVIGALTIAAEDSGESLRRFLSRGEILVHGTTHAINAIVTKRTARTAFLTTAGHPDTLVFREGGRQDAFNFTIPYPAPFVPKALTFEIPERVRADGSVAMALDETAVHQALKHVAAEGVDAIAVCLLWSIVNPEHEARIGRIIEDTLPGMPYTLSHQINPSIREYRRAMSTCLDAALKPIMSDYIAGLENKLGENGFSGRLLIVTSLGGMVDAAHAAAAPVKLINSGPSLAPVGARQYAADLGAGTLIVGDAGGTTFDVSLVRDGHIPRTRETWLGRPLSSHMTGMPSIDTRSIGAGGGSIAWVDQGGLLHVGPESAGAFPGPVAYGKGGTSPTVTDASVVAGYIDAENFLGGRMILDREAALGAIHREVAGPLKMRTEEAAVAIVALATEQMVQAIMDITVNQGIDPAQAVFVAGGGAAGLNCVAIGRRLGCRYVLIPETGAALAAAGALVSDLIVHHQAMFHTDSRAFDRDGVNAVLGSLEMRCREFAAAASEGPPDVGIDYFTEARYPDQAWEIEVPLRHARFENSQDVENLVADFHTMHQELFAINDPGSPIETVGWGAIARCGIGLDRIERLAAPHESAVAASRRVFFSDTGWLDVAVLRLDTIEPRSMVEGPAIVESGFTSIVIDRGALAWRDDRGSLIVDPHGGGKT